MELITYQASGIGRACALGLARDGAAGIMIADLNIEEARQVAAECMTAATTAERPGFRVEEVYLDVTREGSVRAATDHALEIFGRIDYCINCAGVSS